MSNRSTAGERFREALVELINAKIREDGIAPEQAATVLAEEARAALSYLAWLPSPQRAAHEHLVAAVACLRDGRVIPVPEFDVLFPTGKPAGAAQTH